MPSDSVNYYGDSNPNSSFYEYTAYIENPQNLKKGDSLELTIDTSSEALTADYISTSHMSEQRTDSHIYTRMTTESSKSSLSKQASHSGAHMWR